MRRCRSGKPFKHAASPWNRYGAISGTEVYVLPDLTVRFGSKADTSIAARSLPGGTPVTDRSGHSLNTLGYGPRAPVRVARLRVEAFRMIIPVPRMSVHSSAGIQNPSRNRASASAP